MTDVARLAGVSHQTVSRVLNAPELVRPETRQRVLDAIQELDYRRNLGARALATRQSRLIGVMVAQSGYFGPGQTSSSIQVAARSRGFGTIVAALKDSSRAEVSEVLDLLLEHSVEGLVVIAPLRAHLEVLEPVRGRLPVVLVADGVEAPAGMSTASVDQYDGALRLVRHLVEAGARDIAHVTGPDGWNDSRQRERGWRDALAEAGLPDERLVRGDWSAESGYHAGHALFGEAMPDAVFASNDLMALGVLAAAAERGVSVPDDVLVAGFDDSAGTAYFRPPLTTVRQPFNDLGTACVSALLDLVNGCEVEQRRIAPDLVVRRSTER